MLAFPLPDCSAPLVYLSEGAASAALLGQFFGGNGGGGATFLIPIVIIMALFYLMLIRPERKKRSELEQMLGNLKKNDEVETIGGLAGHVVNAPKDSHYVTLRIDEKNNVTIKIRRTAISRVLNLENQPESAKKESTED